MPTSTSRRAEEMRANRGDFTRARHRQPVPRAARSRRTCERFRRHARRQARRRRRTCCARRSTWPSPEHQHARPGALPHPARARTTTPATSGASTRCTTYAHPIEDALENITHSLCTLEFEDQRPFYDWLLERLRRRRLAQRAAAAPVRVRAPEPHLRRSPASASCCSWSTRSHVDGWDDPRMPTIVGLRRRGYTPEAIQLFCRAHRRVARPTAGSTTERPRRRAARRPRREGAARAWRCSTR